MTEETKTTAMTSGSDLTGRVRFILDILLTAELLEATMYASGLSSGILDGLPDHQKSYFQAALSAETFHVRLLRLLGARSKYDTFYFPPGMFTSLTTFLSTSLAVEEVGIMAYIATIYQFAKRRRLGLDVVAGQVLGVETEHRALLRVVADKNPPDNLCVERVNTVSVSKIAEKLAPFLSPNQFDGESTSGQKFPTEDKIEDLVNGNPCMNPGIFIP